MPLYIAPEGKVMTLIAFVYITGIFIGWLVTLPPFKATWLSWLIIFGLAGYVACGGPAAHIINAWIEQGNDKSFVLCRADDDDDSNEE